MQLTLHGGCNHLERRSVNLIASPSNPRMFGVVLSARSFVTNEDFVMWIDEVEDSTKPGEHSFSFGIFRVQDGRFTEHWETR